MRSLHFVLLLCVCALTAVAATKDSGSTTLKDFQPVTAAGKEKHQQFDFSFESSGKRYVCRTSPKTSLKATDFVVGSDLSYEIKGNKGELKNSSGKEVKCTVVRVESLSAPHQ
jgi:hypothetical protein